MISVELEIRGGNIISCIVSNPDVHVYLIDHDLRENFGPPKQIEIETYYPAMNEKDGSCG